MLLKGSVGTQFWHGGRASNVSMVVCMCVGGVYICCVLRLMSDDLRWSMSWRNYMCAVFCSNDMREVRTPNL